ncbi:MAG: translation initiation factor IF-2 [Pseudomonadota bacterium]
MSDVTVVQFAEVLKVPVEKLLKQLEEAGIRVAGADDRISDEAKTELLSYLRRAHGRKEEEAVVAGPRKITLQRKTQSEIKVSAAQGRARTVSVEVRAKRTYINRGVLEEQARLAQEEVDRVREAEEAAVRAVEQAQQRQADEEARRRSEEENKRRAEEDARKALEDEARRQAEQASRDDAERARKAAAPEKPARVEVAKGDTRYGRKELHVSTDVSNRYKKKKPMRGGRRGSSSSSPEGRHAFEMPTQPIKREVSIPETITVAELAQKMAVKGNELIKALMNMGVMATINQPLDQDTAVLVVEELGHTAKLVNENALEEGLQAEVDVNVALVARPPVVTIMGHVDHGKTSLLDFIRRAKVAAGEAGGITQHIGAYHVTTPRGIITFIDTPGHAAFTSMRARGAQVTDIVVLVVAADDGVMPQTIEAIKHAQAAGVPIVVALNKMDKSEAEPERVKSELVQHGVIPEEYGGQAIFVPLSARTGDGVDQLLEALLLQSELLELTGAPAGPAAGSVLESSIEKGRGAVATVLVRRGTLKTGDFILAGQEFGRVRAMFDERGVAVESAGPSIPVQVLGLSGAPNAGDDLLVLESERKAREVATFRRSKSRDNKLAKATTSIEDVFSQYEEGKALQTVQVVIKADVQGSAEALKEALTKLSTNEVAVKVMSSGVGGITESDVMLAMASRARIIAFNVRADAAARMALKDHGIEIQYYSVIYEAIDDVRAALSGMLSPEIRDNIVGLAQVRDVFHSSKFGQVAGCLVTEGFVKRNNPIRVLRDNVVIFEGALESLRRFKDDVGEVRSGTECGIAVKDYNDVRAGDQIECYERVIITRTL